MRNLVIMPAMAQNRERMNLGEYAEEATIIMDEPVKPANHFIEANTQEVTLVNKWNKPQSEQATLSKAESQKQSTNQPINFWNLIRPSTMKGQLLALIFPPFMKQ